MTHAILGLLLRLHIAIVPLFVPSIGGIHDAQEQVSSGPRWHHIFNTGELEQPDGVKIYAKFRF